LTLQAIARLGAALLLSWLAVTGATAQTLVLATTTGTYSLPIHIAEANGYFADEGVAVRLSDCSPGLRCLRQMLDGQADLATVADLPIALHAFERDDFAVIASFVGHARSEKLVARKAAGITQPRQLEGRRIGVVKGTSAQYFLDTWLLYHGVDPKRVVIVAVDAEQAQGALQRGELDAAAMFEPYAFNTVHQSAGRAVLLDAPRIYRLSFNLVSTRRTAAARHVDLVKVLRAVERAERFVREQPQQAQALMKSKFGLGRDYVDWDWGNFDFRLSLDQSLLGTLEGQARWALREGHVAADRKVPNYLRFVEPAALRQVLPAAVTVAR
jgi:ABC-type nitrate/sulfonate/bicarbonate transport system substrate-binding protein